MEEKAAAAHGPQDTHRVHAAFPSTQAPGSAVQYDPRQLQDAIQAVFDRWDVDRSGMLTLDEFKSGLAKESVSPVYRDDPHVRLISAAVAREVTQRPWMG